MIRGTWGHQHAALDPQQPPDSSTAVGGAEVRSLVGPTPGWQRLGGRGACAEGTALAWPTDRGHRHKRIPGCLVLIALTLLRRLAGRARAQFRPAPSTTGLDAAGATVHPPWRPGSSVPSLPGAVEPTAPRGTGKSEVSLGQAELKAVLSWAPQPCPQGASRRTNKSETRPTRTSENSCPPRPLQGWAPARPPRPPSAQRWGGAGGGGGGQPPPGSRRPGRFSKGWPAEVSSLTSGKGLTSTDARLSHSAARAATGSGRGGFTHLATQVTWVCVCTPMRQLEAGLTYLSPLPGQMGRGCPCSGAGGHCPAPGCSAGAGSSRVHPIWAWGSLPGE